MIEHDCLNAMRSFLATHLADPPANLGCIEPAAANDLPAVVLSLERVQRLGAGLGERTSTITDGTLPWTATIDLANPVLPEEPSFQLLSANRLELILPHGGLVGADAGLHPLGPADLTVTVAGSPRTVVEGAPAPDQVRCDPLPGRLTFGSPLPATGKVVVSYFLGQWEQRVGRLSGALRLVVRTESGPATESLSERIILALEQAMQRGRSGALPGLHRLSIAELGAVGRPDPLLGNARSRALLFDFEFESIVNRPESSGGIIQRIPVTTSLNPGA